VLVAHGRQEKKKTDTALAAYKQVKKKCHKCGGWGHMASQCNKTIQGRPESGRGNGNNGGHSRRSMPSSTVTRSTDNRECYYCHKKGHIQSECRKKRYDQNHSTDQAAVAFAALDLQYAYLCDPLKIPLAHTYTDMDRIERPMLVPHQKQIEQDETTTASEITLYSASTVENSNQTEDKVENPVHIDDIEPGLYPTRLMNPIRTFV
jgi:hypothetical protein